MNVVEKKIYKMNPGYMPKYEPLLRRFAQFGGGAEDEKYIKGRTFSNVYEFYMYAFFIGLYKDEVMDMHEDEPLKKFWEVENWRPSDMVDHLLACAIAKSDFDMIGVEIMDEQSIVQEIRKLRCTIEKFANGGLDLILREIEKDPSRAESDDFFIALLA